MVQVLQSNRQKQPSFLQSIAGGLAEGASQAIPEYFKQQAQQKQIQQANAAYKQLTGQDLSGLPPEAQSKLAAELLKGNAKKDLFKEKENAFKQRFGKKDVNEPSNFYLADITPEEAFELENMGYKGAVAGRKAAIEEQIEHEERIREKNAVKNLLRETGDYDEDEIETLSESYDVPTARSINLKKKEPPLYEPTAQKLAAERTDRFITEVENRGRAAEEKLRGLEEGMMLHKQGATGFKLSNALADYFNNPALADPSSKAFNAAMKSQYSGIGDIVKGKVSNFEFMTFEKRIATAADSPQAAEALMVSAMMESKIAAKERQIMQEKRQEYYEKGESPPADFDLQVSKILRPYADLILHETNQRLKDILNPTKKAKLSDEEYSQFFPSLQ